MWSAYSYRPRIVLWSCVIPPGIDFLAMVDPAIPAVVVITTVKVNE